MLHRIIIPENIYRDVYSHLLQNELEQAAFLFANENTSPSTCELLVKDAYLVHGEGWETQEDIHLEMKDTERAKIMALARKGNFSVIDCHSHPNTEYKAWFSASDVHGITDFALYAKWKLSGRPFGAMVWTDSSMDSVIWKNEFESAITADEIIILSKPSKIIVPEGTWYRLQSNTNRRII